MLTMLGSALYVNSSCVMMHVHETPGFVQQMWIGIGLPMSPTVALDAIHLNDWSVLQSNTYVRSSTIADIIHARSGYIILN